MKKNLLLLNAAVLFACVSMYFGTGWSLQLFTFPVTLQITVENYFLHFVPPVLAATKFFTAMTKLMLALNAVMLITEWKKPGFWPAVGLLVFTIAATLLTTRLIFPYNHLMESGITDPVVLRQTLDKWISLNKIRNLIWTGEWLCVMLYFVQRVRRPEIYA